jgi:TIR domain
MGVWLAVALAGGLVAAALTYWRARSSRPAPIGRPPPAPPATAGPPVGHVDENAPADEDVQFTVYRPTMVEPDRWYPLVAFAHRSHVFTADDGLVVDPIAEVGRRAEAQLGTAHRDYTPVREDAAGALPRGGTVTFVPCLPGFDVNPPSRTFVWMEPVHDEQFRVRAGAALRGSMVRGHVSVYQGAALVAEVNVSILVDVGPAPHPGELVSARRFDKVFMSYSHRDSTVVDLVEATNILDVEYLRDCRSLRAADDWYVRIQELIEEADRFQLFWSRNSMESEQVEQEWRHALALGRPGFVRPVYWQTPLPSRDHPRSPPTELGRLHFQFLDFAPAGRLGVTAPATPATTATPQPAAPPAAAPAPAPGYGEPSWAPPPPMGQPSAQHPGPPASLPPPVPRGQPRSRRALVAAGAIAAVGAVLGLGVISSSGDDTQDDVALPSTSVDTDPGDTSDTIDEPFAYGDDAELDSLTDGCAAGDMAACDSLWFDSPIGSDYEAFASTCGSPAPVELAGSCQAEFDAALDGWAIGCADGSLESCDTLAAEAGGGTAYAAFGASCGGRTDARPAGGCEATLGRSADGNAPTTAPSTSD